MKRVLFSAVLALLALPGTAIAQSNDAQLRAALEAAARGQPVPPHMASHPAHGWIELASLRRNLDSLPVAQGQSFLDRHAGQEVADSFRVELLLTLPPRQERVGIRAQYSPEVYYTPT